MKVIMMIMTMIMIMMIMIMMTMKVIIIMIMRTKTITDHHLIKLMGHIKKLGEISKCNYIRNLSLTAKIIK